MATVNKDFRVKHGLVVEGSTATVNGSNVLTEASTEFLQDTVAAMVDGSHTNLTVAYDDTTGKLTFTAENGVADSTTSDLAEGTNLYFTDERAQDAAQSLLTHAGHNGIEFTYDDANNKLTATVTGASVPTFTSGIIFEGSTPNDFETTFSITDPTADRTITFPDLSGTVVTTGDTGSVTSTMIADGTIVNGDISASAAIDKTKISGTAITAADTGTVTSTMILDGTILNADINASAAIDKTKISGTAITAADTGTVTNTMLAGSIANDKLTNSAITINGVSTSLGSSRTLGTDDIAEGATNKYFTDERAQDAIGNVVGNGLDYDDNTGAISVDPSEFALSAVGAPTGDVSLATYKITSLGAPTQSTDAATKAYVDSVAEGLHIHASAVTATTENIDLSTALENGDVLDGVTLATGNRVLVKNQTDKTQNGIYVVQASGAAVRALDYDAPSEIQSGDFIFVSGGTVNNDTGWTQINTVGTIGTDPIEFTQFSGAGTYLAGNGLTLTGNTFSINTTVTADLNSVQTFTNKTLTSPVLTTPSISGLLVLDNNIVIEGTDDTHETTLTFTDPTQDNTITFKNATGTVAFTSDIPANTGSLAEGTNLYFTDERAQDAAATMIVNGTHTNISVSYDDAANTLSLTGAVTYTDENARDAIGSALVAGSGIGITVNDPADTITIANSGVLSITGTANQVVASASTGAVTLSLPQSIATTSTPTFGALTVNGNITLSEALMGSAVQSLTDGNATVVDAWSPAAYNSAKYIVQMKKGLDIEVLEVLVTVDGNNNVYLTEYANVISNTQLGTTDADFSGGAVRLLVTASSGTTVKVHKTLIEA